jgi:hypothetical protein
LSHVVILGAHELLPMTYLSLVALLFGSMLPLVNTTSPYALPLGSMPLQEIYELHVAFPRALFLIQGLFVHYIEIVSLEKHQTLEGDGVLSLYFHLVLDLGLHHARCYDPKCSKYHKITEVHTMYKMSTWSTNLR